MSKENKLTNPSVFALNRAIECTDAIFYQKKSDSDELKKIPIVEKSIKSVIANRLKSNKEFKIENANLQIIDSASLDLDQNFDTLVVKFNLKLIPLRKNISSCNNKEYKDLLLQKIDEFCDKNNEKSKYLKQISYHYAMNIVNGRWLYRNRCNADKIKMIIHCKENEYVFNDVIKTSLASFDKERNHLSEKEFDYVQEIADYIFEGLSFCDEENEINQISVTAEVKMGEGFEVFPSQELVLTDDNSKKGKKNKILYQKNDTAAYHSQKVSNAIKTVDIYYLDCDNAYPISTNPYGSVTTDGIAYRKENNFYELLDQMMLKDKVNFEEKQYYYIVAMLVNGGIFSESAKK